MCGHTVRLGDKGSISADNRYDFHWCLIGIGAGIGGGIFAQIARTTTEKERTGMYSIAMALRQFGLLVGRLICVIITLGLYSMLFKCLTVKAYSIHIFSLSVPALLIYYLSTLNRLCASHKIYFPPIFFVVVCFSGPGFNLFLREFNVKLGPFLIDRYTAPGVS